MSGDRFGIGWRPELALAIHRHAGRIDVLEFLADGWLAAAPAALDTLRAWSGVVPIHLHGTGLGLASAVPVDEGRLAAWARLVAAVRPARWSEHLAFVRGGGIELGHLAAPPRHPATAAGARRNLARARAVVGSAPLVENVATLIEPPGSCWDEAAWLSAILEGADVPWLLDLHNLHANACNAGIAAVDLLERLPLRRVAAIHLAGGRRWRGRTLDDHLHPVPEAVWGLLRHVARRLAGPVDVIIERDGAYPPIEELLAEVDRARSEVAAGRREPVAPPAPARPPSEAEPAGEDIAVEALLARLYTDDGYRHDWLAGDAAATASPGMGRRLAALDRHGLELTAASLAAKRAALR